MGYIYMLTSPNGKSYIGQTTRPIQKRFEQHQKSSRCVAIYNAIQYHGWDNFEKDWYECPDEDLDFDEELLVREMGTLVPNGYNLKEGGGSRGKHSEETIQKMSETKTGEKNPMWGEKHNEESRQRMSEAQVGHIVSEETRRKISEAQLGEKNHMFGKSPSDETRQKLSESRLGEKNHMFGKTPSEDTKTKMSESKMGDKNSRSRRVYQYDLDGKYIQSFGSCGEAATHLNKKDGSKISECARGELYRKTSYGFKWSYVQM
jgi:hypothetical protein